ncbi:taste receptor type 2 member 31-like [Dugong dugon]
MAEFILGNFANGFIALVNRIDFVKRQKISSADKILTALAVFRISLLWIILINWYPEVFNPVLYRNRTLKTELSDIMSLSNLTIFMLAVFIPFTVSLAPFLQLTFFLWKHLKKMHLNGKRSQDSSTKAHIKAIETVIFFLLLFAINFLSLITSAWGSDKLQVKQIIMLCQAIEFSILQATHLS